VSVFDKYKKKSEAPPPSGTDMPDDKKLVRTKEPSHQGPPTSQVVPKPTNQLPTTPLPAKEESPDREERPGMPGQVFVPSRQQVESPGGYLTDPEACEYLSKCGWSRGMADEQGRVTWEDPSAVRVKAEMQPTCTLPTAGGGKEIIRQCVLPPAVWYYTTQEAVTIQRARERAGEGMDDLIARKELELEHLRTLRGKKNDA